MEVFKNYGFNITLIRARLGIEEKLENLVQWKQK